MRGFLLLSGLLLLLGSCVHDSVEDFFFIEYSGLKMPLIEDPSTPPGEEGRLILQNGKMSTPFYSLKEGLKVDEPDRSFFIVYSGDGPLKLRLKLDGEYLISDLPVVPGREVEYRIPLPQNSRLEGFQVETDADQGSLQILGTGVEDRFAGASFAGQSALIGHGVAFSVDPASDRTELDFDPGFLKAGESEHLRLDFSSVGLEPVELSLTAADGQRKKLEVSPREGENRIDLYPAALGFVPQKFVLRGEGTEIETFGVHAIPYGRVPISIDFNSLLEYPVEAWRHDDYEVFQWNLMPEVLVFDCRDYTVQSAFFKRLAFFVEKDGFRNTLVPNEVLEGRHGWNAHDYRAEDLARFFSAAQSEGFRLNPEELELADVLVENGVLVISDGEYLPGKGAVLSISRESGAYLRRLFLTHEGLHGLFFSDPGLRSRAETLWSGFSGTEKEFWRTFLAWKHYDTTDEYLVVNELQAYLLQQPLASIEHYYLEYNMPRMAQQIPDAQKVIDALRTGYPDHFLNSARYLDRYLSSRWGLRAGNLENLKFRD